MAFLIQLENDDKVELKSTPLSGHQESVCNVAFSADGEYLATSDMNGIIKVWSVKNCTLIKTLEGPEEPQWLLWHSKVVFLFCLYVEQRPYDLRL